MSSWTAASSDCSRPVNNYVHVKTADLYRPNARLTPERQGYQVLTPFGKLGYSRDIDAVAVLNSHVTCLNNSMRAYRAQLQDPGTYRNELLARYGLVNRHFVKGSCGTQEIPLGEPFDRMLADRAQMRERNAEVPVLELVQFGCGEFRVGSLADARDYLLELLDAGDFDLWDAERAADVLGLSGYAREELCNSAPLFRDAVVRLYEPAIESAKALQWRGWALRVLAHKLRSATDGCRRQAPRARVLPCGGPPNRPSKCSTVHAFDAFVEGSDRKIQRHNSGYIRVSQRA